MRALRKAIKLLHTLAAIGFIGALAALLVLHAALPSPAEVERFATLRVAMGAVAQWLLLPSMGLVITSGLLSMAVTPAYQNAGWVWAKLLSGILIFEGTLVYVQAPMERAAERGRAALEGGVPVAELGGTLGPEWGSFWIIGAVGVVNVVLGIWRPRLVRFSTPETESAGSADATRGGSAED